jgi:hypothetical protein
MNELLVEEREELYGRTYERQSVIAFERPGLPSR